MEPLKNKHLKILILTHRFYPEVGGIETNSEILATVNDKKKKKRKREIETFMRMALPDKLKGRIKKILNK